MARRSWYSGIQFQQGKIAQLARAMLMRNPTRIEFKVEDAQARAGHSGLGLGLMLVPAGIHPEQGETKATKSRTDVHTATRPATSRTLLNADRGVHRPVASQDRWSCHC